MAVVAYGLSMLYSVFLWRKGFRRDNRVIYILLLAAFGLHSIALFKRGFSLSRCPVNNLYEATIFVVWVIAAAYLALGLWRRLRFLGAFASPLLFAMGVFALMPGLDSAAPDLEGAGVMSRVHASIILLGYGAFGVSAVAGLMYLSQERDLKHDKVRAVLSRLPPIQRLEAVMWPSVIVGFLLLTVGLVLGAGGLKRTYGTFLVWDAKIVWSAAVWVFYLMLLLARWRFSPGGRILAWSVFGGFCFIILTFWGFNLLSGIHNP